MKFISTLRESGCAPESIIEKCAAPAPRAEYAVPFFMPFGKYKGVSIRKVPTEYLSWMWASMDMDAPLKTAVRKELESRA